MINKFLFVYMLITLIEQDREIEETLMGCTNSINPLSQNVEQPVKNMPTTIVCPQIKVIKIVDYQQSDIRDKAKKQLIHKKQQKIQQLKNNKEFIQISIETSYCVNKLLTTLGENQLLRDNQLKTLLSKNNQTLVNRKNRYRNLQAREEKMELELRKEVEKTQRHSHLRKTVPVKTKHQIITERVNNKKAQQLTVYNSHKNYLPYIDGDDKENNRNQQNKLAKDYKGNNENVKVNHSQSLKLQSDYKTKLMKKIDMFRSQVNTSVIKENIHL